jgi:hypothetical protein
MTSLPAEAEAPLEEYLTALDGALADRVTGVYLTGSAALGDWRPGRSNLDIVVVTGEVLGESGIAALEELHAMVGGRPYRDAIYVPADAVGTRQGDIVFPATVDGFFHREGHRPEPVLWATLHRHGLTLRGPEASGLVADPDSGWLRDFSRNNLESYWRPWAANGRRGLTSQNPSRPLDASRVVWAALGPGRLHATIATGKIISKTAAAAYTAKLLPQFDRLLERAKAHRLGDESVPFTVADGLAVCDLIDAVANDAASAGD